MHLSDTHKSKNHDRFDQLLVSLLRRFYFQGFFSICKYKLLIQLNYIFKSMQQRKGLKLIYFSELLVFEKRFRTYCYSSPSSYINPLFRKEILIPPSSLSYEEGDANGKTMFITIVDTSDEIRMTDKRSSIVSVRYRLVHVLRFLEARCHSEK